MSVEELSDLQQMTASASRHIRTSVRRQQRGISYNSPEVVPQYGGRAHWYHGTTLYYLGVRELGHALAVEPTLRHQVDHLKGTALIVKASSDEILTTFKERGGIRKVAQNYGSRKRNRATG